MLLRHISLQKQLDTIQNYIFDILAKIDIKIPINGKNYKASYSCS